MARDSNKFIRLIEAPGVVTDHYLFKVDGSEALSEPFHYRLQIRSQGEVADAATWVNASITFAVGISDNIDRKINGRCVRFEHLYQKGGYTEFAIELAASFEALKQQRHRRLWTDKTAKYIVADVLRGNQITFDDSKVGAQPTRDMCVQQNETDFDFVSRLLEDEGVFYYFRYDAGAGPYKHRMIMADSVAGYDDGVPFEISFRRDHLLRGVQGVTLGHGASPGAAVVHEYDFKKPGSLTPIQVPTRLGSANQASAVYDWQSGYADPEAGRRRAKLAIEEAESGAMTMNGSGSYLAFEPGKRFQIDDTRLNPRERRIVIRSVTHAIFDPSGLSEGDAHYDQSFAAQPSADVFRPKRTMTKAVANGPQSAIVVDQNDPEGFGRIKIQYHWDRGAASTCWVRVLQQWAGNKIGAQFVPRPGMEVMIDFLEGDPDRPILVGCLYNGKNSHPYAVPANLTQAGWRTSGPGGLAHELLFEDKGGGEEIFMQSGRDYRRIVKRDETATITRSQKVNAQDITLTASTSIKLEVAGNTIVIDASGVTINGKMINLN
ncbi:MAG: type VI secretion system Vgr family protein [Janthinobacterium lividum]